MTSRSPQDVLATKRILSQTCRRLPIKLVDLIIDMAEYWPFTSTTMSSGTRAVGRFKEHVFVMRSKPLCVGACECEDSPKDVPEPRLEYPARRVVWTITSHDQGYSGESQNTKGTYAYSWTGFDAGTERFHPAKENASTPFNQWNSAAYLAAWQGQAFDDPFGEPPAREWPKGSKPDPWSPLLVHPNEVHYAVPDPPIWPRKGWTNKEMRVQSNVQAKAEPTTHVVTWDWQDDIDPESSRAREELDGKGRGEFTGDGRLVRSLQRGDCVTLWAHAFFPGWVNNVQSAKIEVYFAI